MHQHIASVGQLPINACYYRAVGGGSTAPMNVVLLDRDLAEIGTFKVPDPLILRGMTEVVRSIDIRRLRIDPTRLEPLGNGYLQVLKPTVASVHQSVQSE